MNNNKEQVIDFATRRLNDPSNSSMEIRYWAAYIDGAKAQLKEIMEEWREPFAWFMKKVESEGNI